MARMAPPLPDGRSLWLSLAATAVHCEPSHVAELKLQVIRELEDEDDDLCGWQLRILIAGTDLTSRGCGMDPDELLPKALLGHDGVQRVVLVRCGCGTVGCGSTSAVISRTDEEVIWGDWISDQGPTPATVRFDASAYDAEVRRADEDRAWEPPERRTARLTRGLISDELVQYLETSFGYRNLKVHGTRRNTVEVWFDVGEWQRGHWQIWVDVTGLSPDAVIHRLASEPPHRWPNVEYFPNDEHAGRNRPPGAGRSWRRTPLA